MTTARKPALRTTGEPTITEGSAERRLWQAVLESARHELWNDHAYGRRPSEVPAWLASEQMQPGAFAWICEFLDLDPDAVRRVFQTPPEPNAVIPRRPMPTR